MSIDKQVHEAERWLTTAEEDLDAAHALMREQKFSHACFFAQQCGEKALKALWYSLGEDPWGHSIQKLIAELPAEKARSAMQGRLEEGAVLDRYYIPTRYPNGLPDLTPGKCYFERDAELCLQAAGNLLARVVKLMKGTG